MSSGEEREVVLAGGMQAGTVRVGDTVRRRPPANPDALRALWRHVRARGFDAAPEFLGTDGGGRDILRYVDGRSGSPPVGPDVSSDDALAGAARMVRAFHDATVGFGWDLHSWPDEQRDPAGPAEVVCHNDIAPFNIVYAGRRPVALIDWDTASPGRRVWDLAYAAWRLVPLHRPAYCEAAGWTEPHVDRARRLRLFCDEYGADRSIRSGLLDVVRQRQIGLRDVFARLIAEGRAGDLRDPDRSSEAGDLPYLDSEFATWSAAL